MVSNVRVLPLLGLACHESEFVDNALLLEKSLSLHLPPPPPLHSPYPPLPSNILHRQRPATYNSPPPATQVPLPASRTRPDHSFSSGCKPTRCCSSRHSSSTARWNKCAIGEHKGEGRSDEGSSAAAPATTVGSAAGRGERRRAWRALAEPVSVALFECSLQMETRDPFDTDVQSGLRSVFISGESDDGNRARRGHGENW